jgi:hypothetical protein
MLRCSFLYAEYSDRARSLATNRTRSNRLHRVAENLLKKAPVTHTLQPMTNSDNNPQYGIRVKLPADDPFMELIGQDWQTTHWFDSQTERDLSLSDMAREHEYSRRGDKPTLIFEPVNRSTDN